MMILGIWAVPGAGAQVPEIVNPLGHLLGVELDLVGFPYLPSNGLVYDAARYQLISESGEGTTLEVYRLEAGEEREGRRDGSAALDGVNSGEQEDPVAEFLSSGGVEAGLCAEGGYRYGFEDRYVLAFPGEQSWFFFVFPDRSLGVCEFVDAFFEMYRFFQERLGQGEPRFPGIVGGLPD
ncbi:hypothetical protein [Spirochaeta lutea]|nr:hypothetical protein [Spirochaeta lutea]